MTTAEVKKPKKRKSSLRNRALSGDRPKREDDLRRSPIAGNKNHPCHENGHDYRFLRDDRYGCCKRCGDEVLT